MQCATNHHSRHMYSLIVSLGIRKKKILGRLSQMGLHYSAYRWRAVCSADATVVWHATNFCTRATSSRAADARTIFQHAVDAVKPQNMVKKALQVYGDKLSVDGRTYKLDHNVHVLAFGKAVLGMVRSVQDVLGEHVVGGVASIPHRFQDTCRQLGKEEFLLHPDSPVEVIEGAVNNLPDAMAMSAAKKISEYANCLDEKDLTVVLISGGGSALLPLPKPPVLLEDLATVTRLMASSGATIQELNVTRKTLEQLKGGGLAEATYPSKIVSLILSDVIGDPLNFIASGPTVPNLSTVKDCMDLLNKYKILDRTPQSIMACLSETQTKTPFDCSNAQNVLVGTNRIATEIAAKEAERLGYLTIVTSHAICGIARDTGIAFAQLGMELRKDQSMKLNKSELKVFLTHLASNIEPAQIDIQIQKLEMALSNKQPVCILGAGETTVTLKGSGKGGRNQEMALACALELDKYAQKDTFDEQQITFLSAGTDGQDGPTDAAGALADSQTVSASIQQGLEPTAFLENNDSYSFYKKYNNGENLVVTGLTGTNVMDIQILLC